MPKAREAQAAYAVSKRRSPAKTAEKPAASDKRRYIVDGRGRKTAVILPIKEYEELLEDLHDLAIIIERRDEPGIPWEEVESQLKADGVLPD